MRTFTFSTVLAVLFASATALPHHGLKRDQICSFDDVAGLSITTNGDGSGKVRWDLFQNSGGSILQGQLAWFNEKQPDSPATFKAVPSSSGPTIFSFQRETDYMQVVADGKGGFNGQASGGTEFKVTCGGQCNAQAARGKLVANGCTMEVANNGQSTGQCVSFIGGSTVPVTTDKCSSTPMQQVDFWSA